MTKLTPPIVDLFSGAGGLSLGAARAGFFVSGAVETDKFALSTHRNNFPFAKHIARDVASLNSKDILDALGLGVGEVFGLIGGPPCQGFSSIGHRQLDDPRNTLFGHFFRLVETLQPAFFLAENVTGILHQQYDKIRELAFSSLPQQYSILTPLKIRASDYGVPTSRTRIFFIGYDASRFKSKLVETDFCPPSGLNCVTVKQALLGLPISLCPQRNIGDLGWQAMTSLLKGLTDPFYIRASGVIPKHIGNKQMIEKYMTGNVSGCFYTKHSPEIVERYKALALGQQDKISKSVKLNPDGLCPTLRAGTGREKGSYQAVRPIHYASPRVITPREAARLQGFPDWFVFQPTIWHSFRQIGNSVSPIVAESILRVIHAAI